MEKIYKESEFSFKIRSQAAREINFGDMVRPIIEYGSAAWDPYYEKDIKRLERIQRKAARFCAGNYNT